jgi:hypothetical protein
VQNTNPDDPTPGDRRRRVSPPAKQPSSLPPDREGRVSCDGDARPEINSEDSQLVSSGGYTL